MKWDRIEVPHMLDKTKYIAAIDFEEYEHTIKLEISKELLLTTDPRDFGTVLEGFCSQYQAKNKPHVELIDNVKE